jgi:DNA-binding FadR family transcriptional regulator
MSVIHDIYTVCMTHSEWAYVLDEMSLRWDKELDDLIDTPKKLTTIRSILSIYICEQLAIYRKSATTPEQIAQAMAWDRAVKMG